MSYDLMVFEPEAAPMKHDDFIKWYFMLTKWADGPYDDPARTSSRLRNWLQQMQTTFPDINSFGEERQPQDENDGMAEYAIGRQFIYAGFGWSKADLATTEVQKLAESNRLGLFEVSSRRQEVWLPVNGTLRLAHRQTNPLFGALKRLVGR